jgi:hypothetical protein
MDARENQLNPRRFDRDDYAPPPPAGRGYSAVDTDNPDVIKSRIDRTRAEMDETVDALQHKLSLDYVIERTIGSFRDSAGRSRVFEMVRENPIPATMIGLGVAWLLFEQSGGSKAARIPHRHPDDIGRGDEYDWLAPGAEYYERRGMSGGRGEGGKGMIGKAGEKVSDVADQARDAAGNLIDRVRDSAGNLVERVRDTVSGTAQGASHARHQARERMSHMGHDARERAEHLAHDARQRVMHAGQDLRRQAERARNGFWHTYEDNPLMMGAGALCLGLLLGLSVPTTRAENRVMGEASDELGRKARKLGEDVVRSSERVAEKAVAAAKDAAHNSGTDDVVDKARAAVTSAASAAQHEARKEGEDLARKTGVDKLGNLGDDTQASKTPGSTGSDKIGGVSGTTQKQDLNRPAQPGPSKPGGGFTSGI